MVKVKLTKTITGSRHDLDEMVSQLEQDISENGSLDRDQFFRVMYAHLFFSSSPFNLRTMMSKITALEEKVEQKEQEITALNAKIQESNVKIQELQSC